MAIRRAKPPVSVYLDPSLRSKVEVIARKRKRDVSPQIEIWVERAVERIERREQEQKHGRTSLCPA